MSRKKSPGKDASLSSSITSNSVAAAPTDFLHLLSTLSLGKLHDLQIHISNERPAIVSCLQGAAQPTLAKVWTHLHLLTTQCLEALKKSSPQSTAADSVYSKFIHSLADLVDSAMCNHRPTQAALTSLVRLLKDCLASTELPETTKRIICKVCDRYYRHNLEDKNSIAYSALLYLIKKCVDQGKALKAELKIIYNLRNTLIHFGDYLILEGEVRELVLTVAQTKLFSTSPEGVRFLAFLFTLSPSLIKEIHKRIKTVLPGLSKSDAKAYAEVYFKAWSDSSETSRTSIEEDCIQDFMLHGVLANRSLPKSVDVVTPLFCILSRFHHAAVTKPIQEMVFRLWQPLLWRHLNASYSMVRINALIFFFDAFPIEDPNEDVQKRHQEFAKQIDIILRLLDDEVADVRSEAALCVGPALSRNWPILSNVDLERILTFIIKELAFDGSSMKVRCSVLTMLRQLLEACPRSHVFLGSLLPCLGARLYDKSEKVRSAMIDLLLVVKKLPAIQYWNICSIECIMDRLSEESMANRTKLSSLISNSFFPKNQSNSVKLKRCIFMLRKNMGAARNIYWHSESFCDLHDAVSFLLFILVTIKKYIHKQRENVDNLGQTDDEPTGGWTKRRRVKKQPTPVLKPRNDSLNTTEPSSSISDVTSNSTNLTNSVHCEFYEELAEEAILRGLVQIACIMYVIWSRALMMNSDYRSVLLSKASGILNLIFQTYKQHVSLCRDVVYLSSLMLSHSSASNMASFCFSRIKSVSPSVRFVSAMPPLDWEHKTKDESDCANVPFESDNPVTTYLMSLCNWGRSDDLLDLITSWFKGHLKVLTCPDGHLPRPSTTGRRSLKRQASRAVRFQEPEDDTVPNREKDALALLRCILVNDLIRRIALKKNPERVKNLLSVLQNYMPVMQTYLRCDPDLPTELAIYLAHVWNTLVRLETAIHLNYGATQEEKLAGLLAQAKRLVAWYNESVISCGAKDSPSSVEYSDFRKHLAFFLNQLSYVLIDLSVADHQIIDQMIRLHIDWAVPLVTAGDDIAVRISSQFCTKVTEWCSQNCHQAEVKSLCDTSLPELLSAVLPLIRKMSFSGAPSDEHRLATRALKTLMNLCVCQLDAKLYEPFIEQCLDVLLTTTSSGSLSDSTDTEETLALRALLLSIVTDKKLVFDAWLLIWNRRLTSAPISTSALKSHVELLESVASYKLDHSRKHQCQEILQHLRTVIQSNDPSAFEDEQQTLAELNSKFQ